MIENPTLEQILENSNPSVSAHIKELFYDLLVDLREKNNLHGITIVLGYKEKYAEHIITGMNKDLFEDDPISVYNPVTLERLYESIADFEGDGQDDGAVLADSYGVITNSGAYLEPRLKRVLFELGLPNDRDPWRYYGFAEHVGSRHLTAIATSYRMPESTVFTLSGSTKMIRVYERAKIIFSPVAKEMTLTEHIIAA